MTAPIRIILILCFTTSVLSAQTAKDSARIEMLGDSAIGLAQAGKYKEADLLAKEALQLAEEKRYKRGILSAQHNLGNINYLKGDYAVSLQHSFQALAVAEEIHDLKGQMNILTTVANAYIFLRDNVKAREYYFKGLEIAEASGDSMGIARCYSNIATSFEKQADSMRHSGKGSESRELYMRSLDHYEKSLAICERLGIGRGIEVNLGNIGNVYSDLRNYGKAYEYLSRSLALSEARKDARDIGLKLFNIGTLLAEAADTIKDPNLKKKEYARVLDYLYRSLQMTRESADLEGAMQAHMALSQASHIVGKDADALEHYKKAIVIRDSLYNEQNTKKTLEAEMNYEFEKKEAISRAEAEKERQRAEFILISMISGLVVVSLFSVFLLRANNQKRKANRIITEQKHEVERQKDIIEVKQKEILDSIRYAKRIQNSMLPTEKYIERHLADKTS